MARAVKCDICGKYYDHYGQKVGDKNGITFVRTELNYNVYDIEKLDCCKECLNAIEELIKNRKD